MDFAWDPAGGDVTLPVYYFWQFGTGPNGDFKSLVRHLHGVPLPPGLGRRKLLLDYPIWRICWMSESMGHHDSEIMDDRRLG